ncbi:MAG: TraR/DksA C4-type zinc finger protein [Patescibacteria group bacterium]|nr:TraR/DksA C4-type zinc finger protein [Patescibacteria group bacterium]
MHTYLIYIVFAIISLYVFWLYAKEEGFINEDIFDATFFCVAGVFVSKFVLKLNFSHTFLTSLLVFLLFVKLKRWSVRKAGDTAIIPFVLFLFFATALNAVLNFSGENVLLFGLVGLILAFLFYLRTNFFMGVSSKRARMSGVFGTFLNGALLYLGLLLICVIAIIFLGKFSLRQSFVYLVVFLAVLLFTIKDIRKPRNFKMVKEQIVDKIKNKLAKEKKALEEEEKLMETEDSYKVAGRDSDNADILGDVDEDVSHEINRATLGVIKNMKAQVEKALARIKRGKYGICEVCGRKIEPARLKAYPETTLCLKCSQKAE